MLRTIGEIISGFFSLFLRELRSRESYAIINLVGMILTALILLVCRDSVLLRLACIVSVGEDKLPPARPWEFFFGATLFVLVFGICLTNFGKVTDAEPPTRRTTKNARVT